jgi:hypothetical protein
MSVDAAPGPGTDRLVAERFMGWRLEAACRDPGEEPSGKTHWHDRRGAYTGWSTENCCYSRGSVMCDVFAPSTESRHALDVVIPEIVRRGMLYRMAGPGDPSRPEMACDIISADGLPLASGRGPTTALAVCRAVLALPEKKGRP